MQERKIVIRLNGEPIIGAEVGWTNEEIRELNRKFAEFDRAQRIAWAEGHDYVIGTSGKAG